MRTKPQISDTHIERIPVDPLEGLRTCPTCSPFRRDLATWHQRVRKCPRCSASLEAFSPEQHDTRAEDAALDALEHFDPALFAERREGVDLAERLSAVSAEKQAGVIETNPEFHHWGLAQDLLAQSERLRGRRPKIALVRAEAAVAVAQRLDPERYHPAWVADLLAKAYATLGRAQRRQGRFREAERSFVRAGVWLHRGTGGGRARAAVGELQLPNRLVRGKIGE